MIIAAPQLSDWGNTSVDQTIALSEFLINTYNIDYHKVFMNGYSGGGETLSLVMAKKPELYTAVLHSATVWDGELIPLVSAKIPTYFVIGENDEYYGSNRISETYSQLYGLYIEQGLSDEEIDSILVLDIKPAAYFNNNNQHGGASEIAFDEKIMGWLFNR